MCGIAGVLDWQRPVEVELVRRMTARMRHRGPDHGAVSALGPLVLGHRRLAIIDLRPDGNQPMADRSGRYWIAFNGEIYNYRALAREFTDLGIVLGTRTDTEVILEAYKRWGVDCLAHLNGMFAFALWDTLERRLFLARDRLGEKPLFYSALPGGGIAFASELKALRCHPLIGTALNPRALSQYLSLNYVLTNECMLAGVAKLPPAHYLVVEAGRVGHPRCYWQVAEHFQRKQRFRDEHEAGEALTALLEDAVRLRLGADVPLGAFLSGGLDSGAIVAAMNRVREDDAVRTFTIGFGDASYDEVDAARVTAGHLHTRHHDRIIDVDMAMALPEVARAHDEPFADSSMLPTYFLTKFARQDLTVCLSGDGGDELFAGYPTYVADRLRHLTGWLPSPLIAGLRLLAEHAVPVSFAKVSFDYKLRQFLRGHALDAQRAHYFWRVIQSDRQKAALLRPEQRAAVMACDPYASFQPHFAAVADCHYLDQGMYVDLKTWLVDDILVKVDQCSMAHSLEVRTPFLDHRLVEFAAALPIDLKLRRFRQKYLLRASQRRFLPPSVAAGGKRGFNAPVSEWINGRLGAIVQAAVTSAPMREWFDRASIDRLLAEHAARKHDHGLPLFGLTCLGLWMEASYA